MVDGFQEWKKLFPLTFEVTWGHISSLKISLYFWGIKEYFEDSSTCHYIKYVICKNQTLHFEQQIYILKIFECLCEVRNYQERYICSCKKVRRTCIKTLINWNYSPLFDIFIECVIISIWSLMLTVVIWSIHASWRGISG